MKVLRVIFIVFLFWSCDDGNINVNEFDFTTTEINSCGHLVLSKINKNEVLIIKINSNQDDLDFSEPKTFNLTNGGNETIIYRVFDEAPTRAYFCSSIPPSSPKVVSEWLGSGTLHATTIIEKEDDQDGIDEPNNLLESDPLYDTDKDGIPNYKDNDDDGDGILTIVEGGTLDTDNDNKLNYLDNDDDGDGTPTIEESYTASADNDDIPDYLDTDTKTRLDTPNQLQPNIYSKSYHTEFIITLLELTKDGEAMKFDTYTFGNSKSSEKEIKKELP